MKCALYIRTPNKIPEGIVNLQKEQMVNYVNEKNWTIEATYSDISLGSSKQYSYQNMLKDATENKFDVIIATELSRLSRRVDMVNELFEVCKLYNIHVVTLDKIYPLNTVINGYQILDFYSKFYKNRKTYAK